MINLQVDGLTKSFGDLVLFENISFGINEGERIGLIAKNGAGKTTLMNILTGKEDYDSGAVVFRRDVRVGYLSQDPSYDPTLTVLEACFQSDNEAVRTIAEYERIMASDDHKGLEEVLHQMEILKAWDYEQRAKQILSQLKIRNFEQKIGELSGGQLKRVALANVLIAEPELLILDEPTNHLDLDMTEWLEEYLNRSRISLLMVTHDRYFLDRVCNEIVEIDRRSLFTYKGNYSYYLEKRQERIDSQNTDLDRASNLLRKELEWMRRQPKARTTKAKYRVDAYYELEKRAQHERDLGAVSLGVKSTYIGNKIFEIEHLCKRFDDLVILEDFNYIFSRYEKLGIVGNNGTGKSTFIKLLMGQVQADSGKIEIGETIRFGYYSQDGLRFDESMKVIDVVKSVAEVIEMGDGSKLTASQLLQHFLFPPETQYNFVSKLSGGERRRLYLCTVLMQNPNFLVLDEPTNDLDIVTLNVLEEYLAAFKGCVIVVSHDRYFMDKVVDHIMVFEGNGKLRDFPGHYSHYRAWKEMQLEEAAELENQKMAKPAVVVAPKSARPEPVVEDKRKLSFNEKREFEQIEARLPILEAEKAGLESLMSSGSLTNEELMAKSARIAEIIDEIDDKTMRWLDLSEYI